ncbi:enoyl-CoA hydratase/isomerase family protein [Roseomonas oryzicola]|uniref:Enoyl-CoA hydratase/isomerase family protein n=1 Tax=Neoroseomonas oryzicola TaxID=535904 RepID=A0A9X9WC91_9PROT|nr:enoyl-CoA hydratase/isomerase family protein [Neoroseomonas oryzicola]MBR0657951.1 enoyl-CoA hydratase/isomerase family protein [Neoroseomonas oryzicola]NKE18731.1 enoyl-CoA hydratase/isomerase family protein [Neoroseomonas oryzicola]
MDGAVTTTLHGPVAELLLDRPAKHNAVTPAMAAAIAEAARALDADDAVRVVLLRGAGERAFCAGSDLNSLAAYPSTWHFRNRVEYATAIRNIRKPVIAALQGWTLGGGAEMALGADIRIAAEGTRFGFPEVTRGWVGGGGASQMLPRMIGAARAMRMLMTGDPIEAAEAQALGLFDQVVPQADLLATAQAMATKIAGFSPVAVQSVKASVRMAMEAPLTAGLLYENEMNVLCFSAGDHLEGIRAFAEKRGAAFSR